MARRHRPWWLDLLILAAIPALLAGAYLHHRAETQPWLDLIAAGKGKTHYVAVEWMRCRSFPGEKPRREKLNRFRGSATPPAVEHRNRVAVVTRRDGWALAGVRGEICWLPDWAITAAEPQWLPCDRRDPGYYRPYPDGWVEPPPAIQPGKCCCNAGEPQPPVRPASDRSPPR